MEPFGSQVPYSEPLWLSPGFTSPYYKEVRVLQLGAVQFIYF